MFWGFVWAWDLPAHGVLIAVGRGTLWSVTEEPEQRRITVNVRMKPSAVDEIDSIAEAEQRTRGDMIRILLADGIKQYRRKRQ